MSSDNYDLIQLLDFEKCLVDKDKRRLGLMLEAQQKNLDADQKKNAYCDNVKSPQANNNEEQSAVVSEDNKENFDSLNRPVDTTDLAVEDKTRCHPLVEPLNLKSLDSNDINSVERKKQEFVDRISSLDTPLTRRSDDKARHTMLRCGEYSPNNPQLRNIAAQPFLGIGEYEQYRNLFSQQRRTEYLDYLTNSKAKIQYELHKKREPEKELSPQKVESYNLPSNRDHISYRVDQKITTARDVLSVAPEMDKPKSILSNRRTGSSRDRYTSNSYKNTYTPSFMDGFSFQDRTEDLEREKRKRDSYYRDLQIQIEEKRKLKLMRDDQERRENELENKRLEQQLLRMQEEAMVDGIRGNRRRDDSGSGARRHSEEYSRRKHDLQTPSHSYRKHTESESGLTSAGFRNANVASKLPSSHYSPPVTRRNPHSYNAPYTSVYADPTLQRYNTPNRCYTLDSSAHHSHHHPHHQYQRRDTLNRMDSLNIAVTPSYDNSCSSFSNNVGRYDSLSRIDSLNRQDTLNRLDSLTIHDSLSNAAALQRRHSATHQDLSNLRKSPKLPRRSNSSKFVDDILPIPVLKAHSPVAKELKNSVPFNSGRSEACRKLEDKWQIPAVQKNIVTDSLSDGTRSILTQLGSIRMQLQKEQLRMDETLRKRGYTQSKAVDFN